MKIAFLMPNEAQRRKIGVMQESVIEMRPDQIRHFEHLIRSWRIFGTYDGLDKTWKAIKRTLRDRP